MLIYNFAAEDFEDIEGGRAGKIGKFADTDVTVMMDGPRSPLPRR